MQDDRRRGGRTFDLPAGAKKLSGAGWRDARALLGSHRGRLLAGFALLLVSRAAGLALPASSKYLVDEVIAKRNGAVLGLLAVGVVAATFVQAATSLLLTRIVGLSAPRAIMDVRNDLQRKVLRLPVACFDSTKNE